jgi:hypothetical protein
MNAAPYREHVAPDPPKQYHRWERTLKTVHATFQFRPAHESASWEARNLTFKPDEVPEEYTTAEVVRFERSHMRSYPPSYISGEDKFRTFLNRAHEKGYFQFETSDGDVFIPWHDFRSVKVVSMNVKNVVFNYEYV